MLFRGLNQAFTSLNEGTFEITLSVPLKQYCAGDMVNVRMQNDIKLPLDQRRK